MTAVASEMEFQNYELEVNKNDSTKTQAISIGAQFESGDLI